MQLWILHSHSIYIMADLPWLKIHNSVEYEDPVELIFLQIEAGVSDYDKSKINLFLFSTDIDENGVSDKCGINLKCYVMFF